jgi:hypothetical protein
MLWALVKRRKQPQSEVIEELIRLEYDTRLLPSFRSETTCIFAGQHTVCTQIPSKQRVAGSSPARRTP